MAWEQRPNGRKYFYIGRRIGGRVVKDYYGCGPAAKLAEQQLAEQKQHRKVNREAVRVAQEQFATADGAIDQLKLSAQNSPPQVASPSCVVEPAHASITPADASVLLPKTEFPNAELLHIESVDPISCIQTLLARLQQGDRAADSELESLLDQYPDLWLHIGDVGEQAINAWLTLVSGKVPVLALAARKKLDALRAELLAAGTDIATRLHADRVMATWLQVTYADARYAQADKSSIPVMEFLAKRQRQAQQQHLSALAAWRMWRRAQGQMAHVENAANSAAKLPDDPMVVTPTIDQSEAAQESWILPFPGSVEPRTGGRSATGR